MASPLIEGIDNEVLFVVSVLVAIVAICLVHLLKNSNSSFSLNSRQNTSNTVSLASSSEGRAQENSSEEQGKKSKQHRLNKTDLYGQLCLISILIDFIKTVSDHELYSIIEDMLYPHPDQTNLDINPTGKYLYGYHIMHLSM